jgi:hypothetical protein
MRTFYTESDIDDLAASGVRQLEVGQSVFLTDAARERAEEGVALVVPQCSTVRCGRRLESGLHKLAAAVKWAAGESSQIETVKSGDQ